MPDRKSKMDEQCHLYSKIHEICKQKANEPGWSTPLSFDVLKKLVLNKKSEENLSRAELLIAKGYFEGDGEQTPNCPLSAYFTLENVLKTLKFLDQKDNKPSSSLIPIKGISRVMQAKLRDKLNVYDVATLLVRGRSHEKRVSMASRLGVDLKLVTSWIKQADLWRVEGMTTDMAYLLVQAGVRNVEDLAKVDAEKAYPILTNINASQVDFSLVEKEELEKIIANAAMLLKYSPSLASFCISKRKEFEEGIKATPHSNISGKIASLRPELTEILRSHGAKINFWENISSLFIGTPAQIEADGMPPVYLFKDDFSSEDDASAELESIYEIINEVLGFLDNVEYTLPLPRTASGTVFIKKADEPDENKRCLPGVLVEIDGIVSPDQDKTEVNKKPRCYTDGNGRFIISMPDRYSLKEAITITISDGNKRQKFLTTASDFIDSVPEQQILKEFLAVDAIGDSADSLSERIRFLERKKASIEAKISNPETTDRAKRILEEALQKINETLEGKGETKGLKSEREELRQRYSEKKKELLERFGTNDLKSTFDRFMASASKLNAQLTATSIGGEQVKSDGFTVIQEIFENRRMDMPRALPSVKLMGEGGDVIKLPTDTAPSRIFTYRMLQRLKEPDIFPVPKGAGRNARVTLNRPVDVEAFKEQMNKDPHNYPQMSTLGIGYTLNMHQAWVPDGFALGTLLYSLILAPGEEQRLVVRENKQRYSITDVSEGADATRSRYALSQEDDTSTIFNHAIDQMSRANSHYSYSTWTNSFGGGGGIAGGFAPYVSATLGLSGGFSKTKGRSSLSSSQSNFYREASAAANSFQHNIKSASARLSQSKRISITTATNDVSDSVATKIVANHNHSHAMTIQYWEVMRRYRLETCIDSVDLVLFVPLKLIRFLPSGESLIYPAGSIESFNSAAFARRYATVLKYANSLKYYLPYKHWAGVNLIQKYAALPQWTMEKTGGQPSHFSFSIQGIFLSCDDIKAYLVLKNGKGTVAGTVSYERVRLGSEYETSSDLKRAIRDIRNSNTSNGKYPKKRAILSFDLPIGVIDEDISHVTIRYSCEPLHYTLYKNPKAKAASGVYADEEYKSMMDKYWDSMKDTDNTSGDLRKIEYYRNVLPEAYISPNVWISSREMNSLGYPEIELMDKPVKFQLVLSNSSLEGDVYVGVSTSSHTLRRTEFQQMEALLQYLASETLRYSQIVWRGLSDDERAMMLEQYTIKMDFEEAIVNANVQTEEEDIRNSNRNNVNIPLLNCVNVKKLLGFYGNCMLLPFTYPQSLAKLLGCTAAEMQDAICRYHSSNFRAPTTTISLPTSGMIGEAVLGETNVSEKIDLTRFWNWQDSPIDKMEIDHKGLNSTDYLAGKTTKGITPLNLQEASAATPVTTADLLTALVYKKPPIFDNITGLDQLKEILNEGTKSASSGRDRAIESSEKMAKAALEFFSANKKEDEEKKEGDNNKKETPENGGTEKK